MSHSIVNHIALFCKILYSKNNFSSYISRETFQNKIKASGLIIGTNLIYVFTSVKTNEIKVIKKYEIIKNGYIQFMIIDENNKHYNFNNSLWFWRWDAIEKWYNINENDKININYYGYRIPFLGIFPKIFNHSNNLICENTSISNYNNNDYKKILEITHWLVI
jgi:hypothetical protein